MVPALHEAEARGQRAEDPSELKSEFKASLGKSVKNKTFQ